MRQRFKVIEGGAGAQPPDADALHEIGPPTWSIEFLRPNAVPEERVAAWRGLLTRLRVADPVFADPDYLLPAAQHGAPGTEPLFAFALSTAGRHQRLEGVIALAMPHPLWGRNRARVWQPTGLGRASVIHPDHAEAIRDALEGALRARGLRADLEAAPTVPAPSLLERTLAPMRLVRAALPAGRDIPAGNLLGIRPASIAEPPSTERVSEPGRIRDAVEEFLALDARVSPRPIVDDPSASALVRVVTRRFAQRRQATVEIVRRADRVTAVRLRLGQGPQAVVWKEVRDRRAHERPAPVDGRVAG